jgi:putative endonuclease
MAQHNQLGKQGEDAAVEFLQSHGHQILVRNYRFSRAEIDIISTEKDMVIFTEVKTRSTEYFGFPEESVDKKKRTLMRKAAEEFMYQHKLDSPVRFDIISVLNQNNKLEIFHIPDAFLNESDSIDLSD